MKHILFAVLCLLPSAVYADLPSPFTFYINDTTGKLPDFPLPATYQVGSTPVGGVTPTALKMYNTSQNTVKFVLALVAPAADSLAANPDFSVTGQFQGFTLSPGASLFYVVNFVPATEGAHVGFLRVAFQIQQNGCVLDGTDPSTACVGNLANISTMTATATPPLLILSYQSANGVVVLQPASSSPLNFPNTSLSATSTLTFTLNNPNSSDVPAPAISLPAINQNAPSAFSLDTSSMPAVITAGASATFTVTFAPSQAGLTSGNLAVGANTYPIQGAGIVVADIDSLQISFTDSTGVRTLPQSATPISFGQVVPGGAASVTLTFSVTNPNTSYNAIAVPSVGVTGAAFSLTSLPTFPVSISPGNTITFKATFAPPSTGIFTGTLSVGARQFALTGQNVASATSSCSVVIGAPLSSQQQPTLTVQLDAPAAFETLGTITMTFASSLPDDPAIVFLATSQRQLQISLSAGSQTATYNGQSAIAFQTGTTTGNITFSVAFTNSQPCQKTFQLPGTKMQLTSSQAQRESPNLLVSLTGYDNTYTAGALSFTFYDTAGKAIGSPITLDAASSFHQLFYTNNSKGGVFTLSGSFPVTGDVAQVGSVTVGASNSQGQTTSTATFH